MVAAVGDSESGRRREGRGGDCEGMGVESKVS